MDKKKQVQEAIKRMELIGLDDDMIQLFQQTEDPLLFTGNGLDKINDGLRGTMDSVMTRFNCLPYAIIRHNSMYGVSYAFFVVSPYEEEWEQDRQMLGDAETCAYVYNESFPELSEFGSIGFQHHMGTMIRTY